MAICCCCCYWSYYLPGTEAEIGQQWILPVLCIILFFSYLFSVQIVYHLTNTNVLLACARLGPIHSLRSSSQIPSNPMWYLCMRSVKCVCGGNYNYTPVIRWIYKAVYKLANAMHEECAHALPVPCFSTWAQSSTNYCCLCLRLCLLCVHCAVKTIWLIIEITEWIGIG